MAAVYAALQKPSYNGNDKAMRVLDEPPTAVGIAGMLTVNTEVIVVMVNPRHTKITLSRISTQPAS